ncbi:MAG TPA: CHAD domain-containing protein [Thermoanaerobaculia bacterium]|nr:CHAD domain-containing protein [Thermoanaerobaculia bacterium]
MSGRTETPPGLLQRPPEEGARVLALGFLDQAAAALPRLADPSDTEALHDLRVALRRLRSTLRSYKEALAGSLPKKLSRRLRDLAGATGPGRDTEVQIEWLRRCSPRLSARHRTGLNWLLARLEKRMREAYAEVLDLLPSKLPALEEGLRRRLSVYRTEIHLDGGGARPTLATATAAILRRQAEELRAHLAAVESVEDETEAHEARISAKRLRYLLEPIAAEIPGGQAPAVVKRLKGLQEILGELHDAHVLETELRQAVEDASAERARRLFELSLAAEPDVPAFRLERRRPCEPGLLAIARLNRERRDQLFAQVRAGWLHDLGEGFFQEVEALTAVLEGSPAIP